MLNMKKLRKMKPPGVPLKRWARSQGAKVLPVTGGEADSETTLKVAKLLGVLPGVTTLQRQDVELKRQKARRERSALLAAATRAARAKKSLKSAPKKGKGKDEDERLAA